MKKSILRRKNSLFYKTQNGARVGDMFTSLIYTSELARVDPFHYLTEIQKHAAELAANPRDWMPWSYKDTLARLRDATSRADATGQRPPAPEPPPRARQPERQGPARS